MEKISQKFKHLYNVISSEDFLQKKSLGGEIPFFISTFHIPDLEETEKAISGLKNKLESNGINVLELNLYNISMDIINRELEKVKSLSWKRRWIRRSLKVQYNQFWTSKGF
ncbi:MAG: hypothetical protein ACOC2E_04365 [Bacteroidota bacterium]